MGRNKRRGLHSNIECLPRLRPTQIITFPIILPALIKTSLLILLTCKFHFLGLYFNFNFFLFCLLVMILLSIFASLHFSQRKFFIFYFLFRWGKHVYSSLCHKLATKF